MFNEMSKVTFQQWQQAKEIFEGALERAGAERARFLDEACGNDLGLREEVESLLRSYFDAGSFMESPAVAPLAESLAGQQTQLAAGQTIKHYEVLGQIGEGGMGEVYLARDITLGRRVALKLLPEFVSRNPDRLRRFKHEARLASTLSHPNVCVIHEIGETDEGQPFIAMEFIEGVTLRQQLDEHSLSLEQALDIAVQVAEALNAAHEAGIVHRDIKPENIMIRLDGYVKVLDFGLAKLTDTAAPDLSRTNSTLLLNSTPGTVMGTAGYMSPEQARGVTVDKRTDVWSLGVVLYEMVHGRPPFVGETATDLLVAIVDKEPAPMSTAAAPPAELDRIVRKALRKNPEERYQIVKEMAIDLRSLQRDLDIDASLAPGVTNAGRRATVPGRNGITTAKDQLLNSKLEGPGRGPRRLLQLGLFLVAAVIIAAAALGSYKLYNRSPATAGTPARFQRVNVTKLTTNGSALFASISPDGKYVGYIKSENGKESLWLRQVGNAGNLEIVPPSDGHYQGLAFSPDGSFIYYGYVSAGASNNAGEIFKVPVLGQGATAVKQDATQGPSSLSHDGKHLAFVAFDREKQLDMLKVANADGSGEQIVATRNWPQRFSWSWATTPAWTEDDQRIALPIVNSDASGFYVSILDVHLADRTQRTIPLSAQRFEQPDQVNLLADASGVIMSGKAQGSSFAQIWFLGPDGSARRLTNDLSDYQAAVLTADSSSFIAIQTQMLLNIWTAPQGNSGQATQLTSGLGRYFDLSWAPDGKIIYASDASGSADIYELGSNGAVRQLTSEMKRNYAPVASPDNRYIAFHSNRSGTFQIWRMDRDGGNPIQLTNESTECTWPQFTPDGKFVIYEHFDQGRPGTIWRVPVGGGPAEALAEGYTVRPVISPDGKWLGYLQNDGKSDSPWRLALLSLDGAKESRTFPLAASVPVQFDTVLRWSPDSRSLHYIDRRAGVENIWAQPIDGNKARQITNFTDSGIFSFDWSRDGNLAITRGVITRDVVLISDAAAH